MNQKTNQTMLYETEDGKICIEVRFEDDNLWLSQKLMAELFECTRNNISHHLIKIFNPGMYDKDIVSRSFSATAKDGKNYSTKFYNLEAIIAVSYRVRSARGPSFLIWATEKMKNCVLKENENIPSCYFEALVEEIRNIRKSERHLYQKLTDIFATSIDYSPGSEETDGFFSTIQNRMHFAITGYRASEIIAIRADRDKPHMGLTNWRNAPSGKVLKSDIKIAKNYLSKEELDVMNRIVNMYLDYAELQASRGKAMKMDDWDAKLNTFLQFADFAVLHDEELITKEEAFTQAEIEYENFRLQQEEYQALTG